MKKSAVLIMLMVMTVLISVGYAEDSAPGSFAIGVHGVGTEWSSGRPTFRWRSSDTLALDFTPVLTVSDFNDHNESSFSLGRNDSGQKTYGLNVGVVKQVRNVGGLSIGWRAEVGYVWNYYESKGGSNLSTTMASGSGYERWEYIDLGFGPDLEYFIPIVPGLTIGASAQIHYRYTSDHYHSETNYAGIGTPPPYIYQDTSRQTTLNLIGELLTIRYYF